MKATPAPMSFPLRISDQLKPHLRALRKRLGLTQSQLGLLVGVKQARIAEIEANPGAVSLDQLTRLLAALGSTLHLHSVDGAGIIDRAAPAAGPKAPQAAAPSVANRAAKPARQAIGQVIGAPARRRRPTGASKPALRTGIVIRPKKGTW